MLLSIQIKIGRILLKMDQKEFSKLIGISLQSFKRLETNDEALANASHKTIQKIIKLLLVKSILIYFQIIFFFKFIKIKK